MKHFIELYRELDLTTSTLRKRKLLASFFKSSDKQDLLWTVYLLSGRFRKRPAGGAKLRAWAAEAANIPEWLMQETYQVVGDLSETIANILPQQNGTGTEESLSDLMNKLIRLKGDDEALKSFILRTWNENEYWGRFVFNKLITGGFRVGVSKQLIIKALAEAFEMEAEAVAHRLMGNWSPLTHTWEEIMEAEIGDFSGQPYPFFLAYALTEQQFPVLEKEVGDWYAEWKWDGIRGQLIKRNGQVFLWSRGEELISNQFPELVVAAMQQLPEGTVLDGEIVVMQAGHVASFNVLQTRLNRKIITDKVCRESPAAFIVYDIPEFHGEDRRSRPLTERRKLLQTLFESLPPPFYLAPQWTATSFAELATLRENARESGAEGLMLKHKNSPYLSGRKSGYWWKWKVAPITLDAVLIYAQAGHGRRANLYTDFTFALWDKDKLVPFAKAYSGLTDAELLKLDKWIKQHTIERFGPVRSVSAELVFELAFEGVQKSSRHKCGYAVRFPRILRWRSDKPAKEANLLEDLAELVELESASGKSPIFD